jgi:hypothetical protein
VFQGESLTARPVDGHPLDFGSLFLDGALFGALGVCVCLSSLQQESR